MNRYCAATHRPHTRAAARCSDPGPPTRRAARTASATSTGSRNHHRSSSGYRTPTVHGRHSVGPFSARSSSGSAKCRPNPPCSAPAACSRLAMPPKRAYASTTHSAPPATRPADDRGGPRPAPPDQDRRDDQRHGQVHGVPRPDQGHERDARAQPAQPAPAPCHRPAGSSPRRPGRRARTTCPAWPAGRSTAPPTGRRTGPRPAPAPTPGAAAATSTARPSGPGRKATDRYTRSAATELVSAATGATSSGTPRARAGSNQAAGACPLTWLT